ncbi:Hypothetical predicted protein [Octopus vulgaris]|uniref:Uncharacterized protein n=1 Tax=Octopus vulgaris TaxID=6645 RepID=A0AA36AYU7_OCTVU|nr:Hypothetical predicted protein [Octopus vulgaris]
MEKNYPASGTQGQHPLEKNSGTVGVAVEVIGGVGSSTSSDGMALSSVVVLGVVDGVGSSTGSGGMALSSVVVLGVVDIGDGVGSSIASGGMALSWVVVLGGDGVVDAACDDGVGGVLAVTSWDTANPYSLNGHITIAANFLLIAVGYKSTVSHIFALPNDHTQTSNEHEDSDTLIL